MQLLFLSTLERSREGQAATGQVSIAEQQGVWRVLWAETQAEGGTEQEVWYEGTAWKEMMDAFRQGLKEKRSAGYIPLIEEGRIALAAPGKQRQVLMLHYYGQMHCDEALFEELRKWRRQQSVKESKSAFFIATNRMLQMVGAFAPQTLDELQTIPGFGRRKAEQYGKDLLAMTATHHKGTPFPLDWVAGAVNEAEFDAWLMEERRQREEAEETNELRRKQVLEGIAAGSSLEELERKVGLRRADLVRMVEELDKNGYDVETLLAVELAELPEEEAAAINRQFTRLGTRVLKTVLTAHYSEEERKQKEIGQLYEVLRLQRIRFLRSREQEAAVEEAGEEVEQAAG